MKRRKKLLTFVLSFVMALGTFGGQATLIASAATSSNTDFWDYTVTPTELPSTGGEVTATVRLMNDDVDGDIYYRIRQQNSDKTFTTVVSSVKRHITSAENSIEIDVPANTTNAEVNYQIVLSDTGNFTNLQSYQKKNITVAATSGDTSDKVLCDEHTYRAKVVDEKGNPVEGVNVNIYSTTDSDLDYNVKTDKDGVATYEMTIEDGAQSFDVTVDDENWTSSDEHTFETLGTYEAYGKIATIETVDDKALTEADEVVFTVQKKGGDTSDKVLCDENTFRAKVVDEKGNPVKGVTVNLTGREDTSCSYDVVSDANGVVAYTLGSFDFDLTFDVTVEDTAWSSDTTHQFVTGYSSPAQITTVDGKALAEADEVVFVVKEGGSVAPKVLSDATHFRAKVVDVDGKPVSGAIFEVTVPGVGTHEITSNENGVVEYELDSAKDYDNTIAIKLKANDKWASVDTYTLTTDSTEGATQITKINGKTLSDEELSYILREKVDKSVLKTALDKVEALGLVETDYTEDSWYTYARALDTANSVYKSDFVNKEDVDDAAAKLEDAVSKLEKEALNKDAADKATDAVSKLTKSDYTEESWKAVEDAQAELEAAIKDGYQSKVDAAVAKVNDAVSKLEKAALNKDAADKATDTVSKLTKSDYTEESWKAVEDAQAELEAAIKDGYQSKVDAAVAKVNEAVSKLVKADLNKVEADKATDAVSKLTKSDYTEESWKAVEDAQAELDAAIKEGLQSKVDAAVAKVKDAVSKLVKAEKPTEPTKPVAEKKIAKVTLSKTVYTYNGKAKKPSVTVKDTAGKKISASEYTVKYAAGRKKVGKYTVTVALKNRAKNTVKASFRILPKKTSIKSVKKAKKAFTVKWLRKGPQVTGYQVQYSTSKTFAKNVKTKTIKGYKANTKKVTKLAKKKTYYVRVRTYKKVGKTTYYAAWSKAKKVTTK